MTSSQVEASSSGVTLPGLLPRVPFPSMTNNLNAYSNMLFSSGYRSNHVPIAPVPFSIPHGHVQHILNIPPIPFRIPPQHFDESVSVAVPDSQTSGKVVEEVSKDPSPAQAPVQVPKRRRRCVGGAEHVSAGSEEPPSTNKQRAMRLEREETLAPDLAKMVAEAEKWNKDADYILGDGAEVKRTGDGCKKRWKNLYGEWKRIFDWEKKTPSGHVSYWEMTTDERVGLTLHEIFSKNFMIQWKYFVPHGLKTILRNVVQWTATYNRKPRLPIFTIPSANSLKNVDLAWAKDVQLAFPG
ncbi:hypothetical protein R1sor_019938 [Riccia sorocarpa]|uniref:Myb-like domain-containing protein n=1 Tax=Riccia sorocarpa TaxID=122646 RepID=A0ABD3IEL4_9MARC